MSRHKVSGSGRRSAANSDDAPERIAGQTAQPIAVDKKWLISGAVVLSIASLWAYWPTLLAMMHQWIVQPDYSHGLLVAPLALAFLWMRRNQFPADKLHIDMWGGVLLLVAAVLRLSAGAFFLTPLDGWTIPIWIAGIVWLLFGWQCLKWSLPAIGFLWFMIPIPFALETMLRVPLQAVAARLSAICLVMLGQPALAEGNTIWLGDQQLFVEEACSGLRIFVGIFALSYAFALFWRGSVGLKAMMVLAAFPIAIIANVFRIVMTGLLYQLSSSDVAKNFSHSFSGMLGILFAAGLFLIFMLYLERLFPKAEQVSAMEIHSTRRR
jgi:exosortase